MAGLHDFTCYLKRGFGRATMQAAADVRNGLLSRQEGFELIKKHDQEKPEALKYFLQITSLSNEEFFKIMDHKKLESLKDITLKVRNKQRKNAEEIKPFIDDFRSQMQILIKFTDWIKEKISNSKNDASAACNDYLKALGYLSIAHSWIKVLEVCFKDYKNNKDFYEDKIQTAKFYFKRVLPRAENHFKTASSGSDYIMNFKFN